MKCWKCGKEIQPGAASCLYCGASLIRPEPVTKPGRAMRELYDHYGPEEVLTNSAYLVNGLGDLLEDSGKLRNRLKAAFEAGVLRQYREQLPVGKTDREFEDRVRILLTEDAGFNEKTAAELSGYLDEMIGWQRDEKKPEPAPVVHEENKEEEPLPAPEEEEKDSRKTGRPGRLPVIGAAAALLLLAVIFLSISGRHGRSSGTSSAGTAVSSTVGAAETAGAAGISRETAGDAMSHEEYLSAEYGSTVLVDSYVQGKTKLADGKASFFLQSPDGACFVYELPCTEEEYEKLSEGQRILVSGTKTLWQGETEITDASFELLEGSYIAEPADLRSLFSAEGAEEMALHQNERIRLPYLEVVITEGNTSPVRYGADGTGEPGTGKDLYFTAGSMGWVYDFVVKADMFEETSELYQLAESLEIGDVVNLEGFLYWYDYGDYVEGNPWITNLEIESYAKDNNSLGLTFTVLEEGELQPRDLPEGLLISAVREGSLGEAAGFLEGDILTEMDGHVFSSDWGSVELYRSVRDTVLPGEKVEYKVLRKNESGEYEEVIINIVY